MFYKLINITREVVLAENAELADTFFTRMKGLLGRLALDESSALIIRPGGSVHTWFMAFSIDVIFLDSSNRIVKLNKDVLPFRFVPSPFSARVVLELPAGKISFTNTSLGDHVAIHRLARFQADAPLQ